MCKIMQKYEEAAREEERINIFKSLLQSGMNFDTLMKSVNIDRSEWSKYRAILAP